MLLPQSTTITSQLAGGDRAGDIYQRLLKERIVFLGTQVDDTSANLICAQLLLLAAEDPARDISLYINSPGRIGDRRPGDLRHHAVRAL